MKRGYNETTLRGKRQTTTPEGAYDSGRAESSDEKTPAEPSFPRICDTGGPSSAPTSDVHEQLHSILQEQLKQAEILDTFWLHSRLFQRAKHYSAIGKISFVRT